MGKRITRITMQIPNSMTLFNVAVGVAAIMLALSGEYQKSAGLILVSVIVDSFDGYVARMLQSTSKFGGYMDTVSDFLSFAVAAAILLTRVYDVSLWFAGFFVVASVARLLYFMKTKNTTHFYGVPTTAAGGLLAAIIIINPRTASHVEDTVLMSAVTVILSLLMLTKKRYYRLGIRKRKTLTFVIAVFMTLFAVNFSLFMWLMLLLFIGYIALGWVRQIMRRGVDELIPE